MVTPRPKAVAGLTDADRDRIAAAVRAAEAKTAGEIVVVIEGCRCSPRRRTDRPPLVRVELVVDLRAMRPAAVGPPGGPGTTRSPTTRSRRTG